MKMINYGIDLRSASVDERSAFYEKLKSRDIMTSIIQGKSGLMEALLVQWHNSAPFPGGLIVPSNCPWREVPPDYITAYQDYIRQR